MGRTVEAGVRAVGATAMMAATLALAGCNAWDFTKKTSEMTGEVSYVIGRESPDTFHFAGSLVAKGEDYHPWLKVRIPPDRSVTVELGTGEAPKCDYIGSGCTQVVRFKFDDQPPFAGRGVNRDSTKGILEFPSSPHLVKAFKKHSLLRVEYALSRGETVVAKFPLAGFASRFVELCGDRPGLCDERSAPELQVVLNQ